MSRLQIFDMFFFNDFSYELREQIIINVFYRIYIIDEMNDVLMIDNRFTYEFIRVNIKLNQRTLKTLKFTSRRMYIEAAKVNRIWFDYETIDFLKKLKIITTKLFIYAIDCESRIVFDFTKFKIDEYRCSWISKAKIRIVILYKRKFDEMLKMHEHMPKWLNC